MKENFEPTTISYHLHKGLYLDKSGSEALVALLDICIQHTCVNDRIEEDERVKTYNKLSNYRSKLLTHIKKLY